VPGEVVLLAGPAGAGKSTLARAWCGTRDVAAHVQLDHVREMVVRGLEDPRVPGPVQRQQWLASVRATCALVRSFAEAGVDVAADDVLPPGDAQDVWRPLLVDLPVRLVVVLPDVEEVLLRACARDKHVPAHLVEEQHRQCSAWVRGRRLDTTGLDVPASLALLLRRLEEPRSRWP